MNENQNTLDTKNIEKNTYLFIFFVFLNAFYAPIFRNELTYCNVLGAEYFSAYNNFLTTSAIFLKVIILIYLLFNIKFIINKLNKLLIFIVFFIFLFLQSLITLYTGTQIISLLNSVLVFSFILLTIEKNYLSIFVKYLFFYLVGIVGISTLSLIIGENSSIITKCYTGGIILGPGFENELNLIKSGLTSHKNTLGLNIFILNFLQIYFPQYIKANNITKFFYLIISIFILLYINSIASLFMTLLITIAFLLKQNKKYFITILSIFIISLYFNTEVILDFFNRDITLSGRAYIWKNILLQGFSYPIIGNGVGNAFILIDNTYIKMVIETGFVFTFSYYIWVLVQFYKNFSTSKKVDESLIFLIIIFYSIIEISGVLYSTNLLIVVMVIVYFNKFVDKKPLNNINK